MGLDNTCPELHKKSLVRIVFGQHCLLLILFVVASLLFNARTFKKNTCLESQHCMYKSSILCTRTPLLDSSTHVRTDQRMVKYTLRTLLPVFQYSVKIQYFTAVTNVAANSVAPKIVQAKHQLLSSENLQAILIKIKIWINKSITQRQNS